MVMKVRDTAGQADAGADVNVDKVVNRLRRVEGQVRGLQRMIEEGKDCEDVLNQLSADSGHPHNPYPPQSSAVGPGPDPLPDGAYSQPCLHSHLPQRPLGLLYPAPS